MQGWCVSIGPDFLSDRRQFLPENASFGTK